MAVSLSLANRHASLPVAYRLYLPQEWTSDHTRRRKAGVPDEIAFKTKPEIALDQLRWAHAAGLPRGGHGACHCIRAKAVTIVPDSMMPIVMRCFDAGRHDPLTKKRST